MNDILINYKTMIIKKELIENYCLKTECTNAFPIIKPELNILLQRFNIDKKKMPINTLRIDKSGIYFMIDNHLEYILSRYNLHLNKETLQDNLEQVLLSLKEIKKRNKLQGTYPKLFDEYLTIEKVFKQLHNIPENKQSPRIVVKKFITKEIDNINYLRRISKDNFIELTSANKYMCLIDENKLKLIIASQIMNAASNEKYQKGVLKYLKEFIIQNKELLQQNYEIKIYNNYLFGTSHYKEFSMKKIYDFINNTVEKEIKEEKRTQSTPTKQVKVEKMNYTFLDTETGKQHEILKKYFKLGTLSKSEDEKKNLLKRKLDYYNNLNITKVKIGVNSFEGYIGLCLENGKIILDKLFENLSTGLIATNEAIYITEESEFEKITKLTKIECIDQIKKGNLKVKRIIHKGSWENRLKKIID